MDYQPVIDKLEAERKPVATSYYIGIAIIVASAICVLSQGNLMLLGMVGVVIGVIYMAAVAMPKGKKFNELYKSLVVEEAYKNAFSNVMYNANQGLSESFISGTKLMQMGNIYNSDDFVSANYGDVHFNRADVTIQDEYQDSDGDTHTTTYFRGRWLVIDCNKNFETSVQIVGRSFAYAKTNKKGLFNHREDARHVVEFEDTEFNKQFKTYCVSDQEAFYLVTPQMMENIRKLDAVFQARMMIGFVDNKVNIAVHNNKNAMEAGILTKVTYEKHLKPVFDEIQAVKDAIDILKLDRRIFGV